MQTRQTKTFQVKEPIGKVWPFLSDPRKVAPCLPGAQITEAVDDRTFKGTITIKIGPVTTSFRGQLKVERLDAERYEMELAGAGQDPGGGGGVSMKMSGKLTSIPGGATEVTGTIESTVTGRLAQFGARMMDEVSNQLFNQFTKNFQERLAKEPDETSSPPSGPAASLIPPIREPAAEPIKAFPLLFSATKNFVARVFRTLFGN